MPSFIVQINGKSVCSVGLTGKYSGSIDLTWLAGQTKDTKGLLYFHIGATERNNNLRWSVPQLEVGDEVTIKIVDATVSDNPPADRLTIRNQDH